MRSRKSLDFNKKVAERMGASRPLLLNAPCQGRNRYAYFKPALFRECDAPRTDLIGRIQGKACVSKKSRALAIRIGVVKHDWGNFAIVDRKGSYFLRRLKHNTRESYLPDSSPDAGICGKQASRDQVISWQNPD